MSDLELLLKEISELKTIVVTRMLTATWVNQDEACKLLGIKAQMLAKIKVAIDKNGNKTGTISWRKSQGKNCQYLLKDIEKYNSAFVFMK